MYFVGSKNTVLWDIFTAALMRDGFWDVVPCGLVRTDDSKEHIASETSVLTTATRYTGTKDIYLYMNKSTMPSQPVRECLTS
jgi:hypothetical protein